MSDHSEHSPIEIAPQSPYGTNGKMSRKSIDQEIPLATGLEQFLADYHQKKE
jgi:hypothetical protein